MKTCFPFGGARSISRRMSEFFEAMNAHARVIMEAVPFARALGMEAVEIGRGVAKAVLRHSPDLIGDPATGVLHGGVVTALLDNISGVAAASALERFTSIATLDLRIDYMRASEPGRDLWARAEVVRMTRRIAFVRATAFHDRPDEPIASATGAFMLGSDGGRKPGHNLEPDSSPDPSAARVEPGA